MTLRMSSGADMESYKGPPDEPPDVQAIPLEQFGKDHWGLLAYVETCVVDNQKAPAIGEIDMRRIRINPARHPWRDGAWKPEYGTRIKGMTIPQSSHDDWDCLNDLGREGLLEVISTVNGFVRLTPKGIEMAHQLREHKAKGGMFAGFVPKEVSTK